MRKFEENFSKLFKGEKYINNLSEEVIEFFNDFLDDEDLNTILIKNEQHSILPDQEKQLKNYSFSILDVSAKGWNKEEIKAISKAVWYVLSCSENAPENGAIIFLSPVPLLIKEVTWSSRAPGGALYEVKIFHNDNRIKKEVGDGKVIHTVAKEGWELV